MPYTPEHKRDTHQKILESARRLFNRKGFSEVSIDEVMENAGLTHGGFYRHFRNKDQLYAEAVRRFLCPDAPKPWQPKPPRAAMAKKPRGQRVIDAYFSRDHFDDRETCCPLIALPSDVMRARRRKGAYREVLEKLVEFLDDLTSATARARTCACHPVRWRHRDVQMRRRSSPGRRVAPCRAAAGVAHRRLTAPRSRHRRTCRRADLRQIAWHLPRRASRIAGCARWHRVRFSNRPFGVKRIQTFHSRSVDVAREAALLSGIGTKGPSNMGSEDEVEQSRARPCRPPVKR